MNTHGFPRRLADEIERVGAFVAGRDDALNIPPQSAEFLHALLLAGRYTSAVEIGTSFGFSGLWLGAALQRHGGTLLTFEIDDKKVAFAREAFERAGLAQTIRVVHGDAREVLAPHNGPFDFAFVDAVKSQSVEYLERLWPKLTPRAVLVADNATSHETELSPYLAHVRSHPELYSTLVPIGSGLELSVRICSDAEPFRGDG